jgi:hypothetical protein
VWDVPKQVTATFRPEDDTRTDGLHGATVLAVRAGCEDKVMHWRLTVDGRPAKLATLTGKREHRMADPLPLDRTPREITITAWWNGGAGACASFGLVWEQPRLSRAFALSLPF